MSKPLLVLSLLFASCTTPAEHGKKDPVLDTGSAPDHDSGWSVSKESCDGLDNDRDGLVDEGFPDSDKDGFKDCVDCAVIPLEPTSEVPMNPCAALWAYVPPENPWDIVTEDVYSPEALSGIWEIFIADFGGGEPLIGFVEYGEDPYPGCNCVPNFKLFNPITREFVWVWPYQAGITEVAMADFDVDGEWEVFLLSDYESWSLAPQYLSEDRRVELATKWTDNFHICAADKEPIVADLFGDGNPEVILGGIVLSGVDVRGVLACHQHPSTGDVDRDGMLEVAIGGGLYGPDLRERWSVDLGALNTESFFARVDGENRVFFLSNHMRAYDEYGVQRLDVVLGEGDYRTYSPTVADFDGDGRAEVAFVLVPERCTEWEWSLEVYSLDGHRRMSLLEGQFPSKVSAWDVDGDGAFELLVAAAGGFYILDGSTGEVRYFNETTPWMYGAPVVADIDGDGSGEILVITQDPETAALRIVALHHAEGRWPASGPNWPVGQFNGYDLRSDGTAPILPTPIQEGGSILRARPAMNSPNLRPRIVETCAGTCEGRGQVQIAVEVQNDGIAPSPEGVKVRLYRVEGEESSLLREETLSSPVLDGRTRTLVFSLSSHEIGHEPSSRLAVSVDDDGKGGVGLAVECDEDDNIVEFASPCAP